MGCCFSGEKEDDLQNPGDDVRRPLLGDGTHSQAQQISNENGPAYNSSTISRTDEQSRLTQILHETANNVIDVSSIEPHSLERGEYVERSRLYSNKLSQVPNPQVPSVLTLPRGSTAPPQSILADDPVSVTDINFVKESAQTVASSLQSFSVHSSEPLVVQFGGP